MSDEETYPIPPASEMPMYEKTLAEAQQLGTVGVSAIAHRPTITEMLQHKRNCLAAELANVDAALAKAKEESGAMGLLDAVAKAQVGTRY